MNNPRTCGASIMQRTIGLILVCLLKALPAQALSPDSHRTEACNSTIEIAFSPSRGATDLVVKAIGEAKKNIRIAAYSLTSKAIAQAVLDAHKRGVDVKVVLDKSQSQPKYTSATFLANLGIPTRIDFKYAAMAAKFMVIDEVNVELGSFDYTTAAEHENAENVLVLRNNPTIARQYMSEWQRLWNESEEKKPNY